MEVVDLTQYKILMGGKTQKHTGCSGTIPTLGPGKKDVEELVGR